MDNNHPECPFEYRGYTIDYGENMMSYWAFVSELPGLYFESIPGAKLYVDSLIAGEPKDHLLIDEPVI